MRKILLFISVVLFSIMLSYAETCSLSNGSLSYQINGCEEQSRACCSGTWCSWGTTSCASCNDTTQACSGNVSGACAGNRTRSVTGSCGSTCTYSGWNDSGCSYTQSCTATSESRNCSGNVTNACAGTQTRTRTVAGTCGSCSYNSWGSWSTNNCSYTQSCTATSESRNCSGNVTNACAGTQTRTRTVAGTCGSCSYNSWGSWSTGGCSYTQSCTATSESRNCSGNVTNACAGTQTRTRTVAGTCGSCSYNSWGSWSTSGCSYTQSCTDTSESTACSNISSSYCSGTATRTRSVTGTCGSCSYGSWGSWDTSGCTATQSCTATSTSCSNINDGYTGGTATRTVTNSCGGCYYSSWNTSNCETITNPAYIKLIFEISDYEMEVPSGASWSGSGPGSITYRNEDSPNSDVHTTNIYRGNNINTEPLEYGTYWGVSDLYLYSNVIMVESDTWYQVENFTERITANGKTYMLSCADDNSGSYDFYTYCDTDSGKGCSANNPWIGDYILSCEIVGETCANPLSCTATSTACSNVNSSYKSGTATRTVTGDCGSCTYSAWNTRNCSTCANLVSCTATSTACSNINSSYKRGTATRTVTGNCGSCTYSAWNTSNCRYCADANQCYGWNDGWSKTCASKNMSARSCVGLVGTYSEYRGPTDGGAALGGDTYATGGTITPTSASCDDGGSGWVYNYSNGSASCTCNSDVSVYVRGSCKSTGCCVPYVKTLGGTVYSYSSLSACNSGRSQVLSANSGYYNNTIPFTVAWCKTQRGKTVTMRRNVTSCYQEDSKYKFKVEGWSCTTDY